VGGVKCWFTKTISASGASGAKKSELSLTTYNVFKSISNRRRLLRYIAIAGLSAATSTAQANVDVIPDFLSSVTVSSGASKIEDAIDSAINIFHNLYINDLTIMVDFSYTPRSGGDLLSTTQTYFDVPYITYAKALKADSSTHRGNTVLTTAIANLSKGNDAGGANDMALTGAQVAMLGLGPGSYSNATININSDQSFAFTRPVPNSRYDVLGGLEHELDEVLGGGGGGSTLNSIASSCSNNPSNFFCNKVGSLDLYRYSRPGVPSFSTSNGAGAYFSVDGGRTKIEAFNQSSSGDFGDFAPPGTGAGQLIQNAFNSTGQDEPYAISSPEYTMMESIGYDGIVPEPTTWAMLLLGFAGLGFLGLRGSRKTAAHAA
jgi:PEP-CTERM motif